MNDTPRVEKARAAGEARARVTESHAGSHSRDVDAALRRYLVAEEYHELHGPASERDEQASPDRS